MEYSVRVQEYERLKNLEQEALTLLWRKCLAHFFHVFFEIVLKVLKDKIELFLGEQDFFKLYNVGMLQVLEE